MLPNTYRITRVEKTLRRFEEDIPMLNIRVKDLSAERQRSAQQFAAALISQTRAELNRLREELPRAGTEGSEAPCEAAD
jgi:hypothetical protein